VISIAHAETAQSCHKLIFKPSMPLFFRHQFGFSAPVVVPATGDSFDEQPVTENKPIHNITRANEQLNELRMGVSPVLS
jgi:hypothetical protein